MQAMDDRRHPQAQTYAQMRMRPPHRPPPLRRTTSSASIHSENGTPLLLVHPLSSDYQDCEDCRRAQAAADADPALTTMTTTSSSGPAAAAAAAPVGMGDPSSTAAGKTVTFRDHNAVDPASTAAGAATRPALASRSRQQQSQDDAATVNAAGLGTGTAAGASPHKSTLPLPLPSPSAVHINQSLEESLRKGEEGRLRRSAERREARRRERRLAKRPNVSASHKSSAGAGGGVVRQAKEDGGEPGALLLVPGSAIAEEDERDHAASAPATHPEDHNAVASPSSASSGSSHGSGGSGSDNDDSGDSGNGSSGDFYDSDFEDDDGEGRSLTRQLAETAVSVREMSRELGRARVKSNIQSVLIVTKARDNQLIKLTRELAIHLMKTPRSGAAYSNGGSGSGNASGSTSSSSTNLNGNGASGAQGPGKGLNVYVDAQLKKSKRFDAAGIEREYPEFFHRPGSSAASAQSSSSHAHHHHHHHSREGSSTNLARRSSTRRSSSTASSSLNLLGMTSSVAPSPGQVTPSAPSSASSDTHSSAMHRDGSHTYHHHHSHSHAHPHDGAGPAWASASNSTSSSSRLASGATSGANTPTTSGLTNASNGKPLTKLAEALVNRQLDRQIERENARRQQLAASASAPAISGALAGSSSAESGQHAVNGTGTASGSQTPMSPGSAGARESSGNGNGRADREREKDRDKDRDGDEQQGKLRYWTAEMCSKSPHLFDLVVTLGGDGTVLFTSWLFQHVVPPVIPFALGSLGFLTNFDYSNYVRVMDSAIREGVRVNLRMRFTATVYRAVDFDGDAARGQGGDVQMQRRRVVRSGETGQVFMEKLRSGGWDAIEAPGAAAAQQDALTSSSSTQGSGAQNAGRCHKDKELRCSVTRPVESFEVLNDLVVDRGPSPYVSLLELFGDEHHMTTVQADGLCVATPTGSTAYSLSAGGSLVHPEIPALLITPICPHTLSFRPMLLPDSMELRICVPYNSRSTAWASFDGRGRVELRQGDHIKVAASQYPFPTVCADKQSTDWFQAIQRTLKWNERQRQKSFVVVEHDREQPQPVPPSQSQSQQSTSQQAPLGPDASKARAEAGYPPASEGPGSGAGGGTAMGKAPPPPAPALATDDDDDGTFDIDDIPASPQQPQPASQTASTSRAGAGATARATAWTGQDGQDQSQSQPDSPHLRQYATVPSTAARAGAGPDSSGRSPPRSADARTPRAADYDHANSSSPQAHGGASSRSRNQSRSRKKSNERERERERVKAFVVFGADSSDADTSASEDDF